MATRRIASKNRTFSRSKATARENKRSSIFDHFRLGESYTSLILGTIVVIIIAILLVSFAKNREGSRLANTPPQETSSTSTANESSVGESYTVQQGDDLWKIAVKNYEGNGYAWSEIARANNITNPNKIEVGQKLTLPQVEKQMANAQAESAQASPAQAVTVAPTSEPKSMPTSTTTVPEQSQRTDRIAGVTYTVVRGDYLWEIAVRAYGDGYQWVKIAQANSLFNPNVIHSGNVLKLPR